MVHGMMEPCICPRCVVEELASIIRLKDEDGERVPLHAPTVRALGEAAMGDGRGELLGILLLFHHVGYMPPVLATPQPCYACHREAQFRQTVALLNPNGGTSGLAVLWHCTHHQPSRNQKAPRRNLRWATTAPANLEWQIARASTVAERLREWRRSTSRTLSRWVKALI